MRKKDFYIKKDEVIKLIAESKESIKKAKDIITVNLFPDYQSQEKKIENRL